MTFETIPESLPEPSEDELRQLAAWNDTTLAAPELGCVWSSIAQQAQATPDADAILGERPLTYTALLTAARHLAASLHERGVMPGDVVALWLRDPTAGLIACVATWSVGAAFVPIDDALPQERVQFVLTDSGARVLLTERPLLARLAQAPKAALCIDEVAAASSLDGLPPSAASAITPDSLAYVIYTSGSTGRPKGVALRHRNLLNFVLARSTLYGTAPRILPLHSLAFDPAVGAVAWTLATGGALLLPDADTRRDPEALRRLLGRHAISHLSAVPALYAAMLQDATPDELRTLRGCLLGGERLPPSLAALHYQKAPAAELFNEYGPTEATITTSVYAVPRDRVPDPLPIGRPLANTRCYVLDEQRRLVAPEISGELYVGGAGVGAGYLNRAELTAERFVPDPFVADPDARMYRTGDRARWLANGQLEFQGRLDFQVKVRGYRIELQEIEHQIERCEGVAAAVAVVVEQAGGENLAGYYATLDGAPRPLLASELGRVLPAYMLPAALIHLPELPTNAAGKVDRSALPKPNLHSVPRSHQGTPAETPIEQTVGRIWCEVLSLAEVTREDDFFALGGHSLSATMVISRLREQLALRVPVRCLFEAPTLQAFAQALVRMGEPLSSSQAQLSDELLGPVPIAPLQATFWYLAQLDPSSAAYVVPARFRLRGPLSTDRLNRALQAVVAANEVLRTRFVLQQGEPIQVVVPELEVKIERLDLCHHPEPESAARTALRELMRLPFDIGSCPLWRCQLSKLSEHDHFLGFAVHHIVFDGWSAGLLLRQLFAAYAVLPDEPPPQARSSQLPPAPTRGSLLPPAPARTSQPPSPALPADRYRQHAFVARTRLVGARLEELLSYWRTQLAELPPPLSLPADRPAPDPERERGGAVVHGRLPAELTQRVRARCAELGVTHFVFNLAVFELIVARWTGEHDVAIGAPMAVRDESHLETMIGCFVNSVVLRTQVPELDAPFSELLERVKRAAIGGLTHAELPFDWIVADLNPSRARRHENPLFRLFFNDIDRRAELPEVPGLTLSQIPDEAPISKFDLTFYIHQFADHDELELVYDPDLFSAARIGELAAQFESVIEQVVRDGSRPLGSYSLRTARARLALPDPQEPLSAAGGDGLLHAALFERAASQPQRSALIDRHGTASYRELAERAHALAARLREVGARPGDRVALYAERGAALVTGLFAVLEAGCSFTILDPDQPTAWNLTLLASLQPRVWLAPSASAIPPELERALAAVPLRVRSTDTKPAAFSGVVEGDPDAPAYVIFTSGTTGAAKGVVGSQRPVRHFLDWYIQRFGITAADRFAMLSGLGHDPLLRDVFTPVLAGATLCIPSARERRDPDALARWLKEQAVSVAHLTPSLATLIAAGAARSGALTGLRLLLFGGERLRPQDVELARGYAPNARLVNCYGTTETPQVVGYSELTVDTRAVAPAIGGGIADTQLLVINPLGEPAGVGELGTIHVRSPYLSRGYLEGGAPAAESDARDATQIYVTGDLGHYDCEGRVHFAGRLDRQTKVRGYRIELPVIEAALEALPGVARAHVIACAAAEGDTTLAAYVVARNAAPPDAAKLRAALQARFVDAMVPTAWAFLEQLPLTANGKVDTRRLLALEAAQAPGRPAYCEPRNQTEDVIARLWAELFKLDKVGTADDFFELGGHSLLAVRMLGTLSERLGSAVPMSLLMKHSSVADLAAALHEAGEIAEEKLVVELRTGGTRPPFWLIHPVGGYVMFARRFVRLIDREQNMLGIQAQGLDGRRAPLETIEAMASHYLELIRAHQPSGPYYIGGPSLGGKICFEMAQQLLAAGEEPALVILFDTFAPGFPRAKSPLRWLRDKLVQTRERGLRASVRRIGRRLIGRAVPRGYLDYQALEQLDAVEDAALASVIAANQAASRSYQVRPYPGTITLFRAADQPHWPGMDFGDVSNGWGKFAARVEVEVIDSTHQLMFDEPAADELAVKFMACHERAYQRAAGTASRMSTMLGAFLRPTEAIAAHQTAIDSVHPPAPDP